MITPVDSGARTQNRARPAGLPDFKKPPLDEVAIGVQFTSIGSLHSRALSLYREAVKAEFPNTEYQTRLPPTSIVNSQPLIPGMIGAQLLQQPTNQEGSNRVWLVARDNAKLVQLQDDRFIVNWRRGSDPYPRFEVVAELFWTNFERYRNAVTSCGGVIEPQMLELSYFNWIDADELPQAEAIRSAQYSKVDPHNHSLRFDGQLSHSSFSMLDGEVPIARLQVQTAGEGVRISRVNNSLQRGTAFNLSYFSALAPGADDLTIDDQLYLARTLIVDAFDELTTDEAHLKWEKK